MPSYCLMLLPYALVMQLVYSICIEVGSIVVTELRMDVVELSI